MTTEETYVKHIECGIRAIKLGTKILKILKAYFLSTRQGLSIDVRIVILGSEKFLVYFGHYEKKT